MRIRAITCCQGINMKQYLQMLDRLVFGKVNNKNAIDKNLKFKEHILSYIKKQGVNAVLW